MGLPENKICEDICCQDVKLVSTLIPTHDMLLRYWSEHQGMHPICSPEHPLLGLSPRLRKMNMSLMQGK